jgi:hypothetical protein
MALTSQLFPPVLVNHRSSLRVLVYIDHRCFLPPQRQQRRLEPTACDDHSFSFIALPDVKNGPVALPTGNPPTTPLATLSKSDFCQVTTDIQHLAKQMSYLAHPALSSLRQKRRSFSLLTWFGGKATTYCTPFPLCVSRISSIRQLTP